MRMVCFIVLWLIAFGVGCAMDVAARHLVQVRALGAADTVDVIQLHRMEGIYLWAKLALEEDAFPKISSDRKALWEQVRACFFHVYRLTEARYRKGKSTAWEAYEVAQNLHWIDMYIRMLYSDDESAELLAQRRIRKAARKYALRLERETAAGKEDCLETLRAQRLQLELSLSSSEESLSAEEKVMAEQILRNFEKSLAVAKARYKNELAPFRTISEIEQEQLRFELYLHLRCGELPEAAKKAKKLTKESSAYYKLLCRSEASPEDLLKARLKMLEAERSAEHLD